MGYVHGLAAHKAAFLKGLTLIVGGLALVLAGTIVGLNTSKVAQISAGLIAVTGVVVAFLGFFVYVLPPLLPDK